MYIIGQRSNINGPTHHYIYITYDIFCLGHIGFRDDIHVMEVNA